MKNIIRKVAEYISYNRFYNNIDLISEIPDIEFTKDKDITPNVSKEFEEQVNTFINVIKENFDDSVLNNFYNNIQTIRIKYMPFSILNGNTGEYYKDDNLIRIRKHLTSNTIYHELFHMASTKKIKGVRYSGFSIYDTFKLNIGNAIDEGYTQLLTKRYFGNDENNNTYIYEILIASDLELIVGKEKMKSLYMQANLYGLIKELEKYVPKYEIEEFLHNTDYLFKEEDKFKYNMSNEYIKKIRDMEIKVDDFLRKAYLNKLIYLYNNGEIDKITIKREYYKYLYSHDCKLKYKNKYEDHPISKIDEDDKLKAIK